MTGTPFKLRTVYLGHIPAGSTNV